MVVLEPKLMFIILEFVNRQVAVLRWCESWRTVLVTIQMLWFSCNISCHNTLENDAPSASKCVCLFNSFLE